MTGMKKIFILICFLLAVALLMPGFAASAAETTVPAAEDKPLLKPAYFVQDTTTPQTQYRIIVLNPYYTNAGTGDAYNLVFTLSGFSEDTLIADPNLRPLKIDQLKPGKQANLGYSVMAAPNLKSGTYPLLMTATYSDAAGESYTLQETLNVVVTIPGDTPAVTTVPGETGTPDLKLTYFGQDRTTPQTSYRIIMLNPYYTNLGTGSAYNLVFTLTGFLETTLISNPNPEAVLKIDVLKPGKEAALAYSVDAAPNLKSGTYPLTMTVTYSDAAGKTYKVENTLNVVVTITGDTPETAAAPVTTAPPASAAPAESTVRTEGTAAPTATTVLGTAAESEPSGGDEAGETPADSEDAPETDGADESLPPAGQDVAGLDAQYIRSPVNVVYLTGEAQDAGLPTWVTVLLALNGAAFLTAAVLLVLRRIRKKEAK